MIRNLLGGYKHRYRLKPLEPIRIDKKSIYEMQQYNLDSEEMIITIKANKIDGVYREIGTNRPVEIIEE